MEDNKNWKFLYILKFLLILSKHINNINITFNFLSKKFVKMIMDFLLKFDINFQGNNLN